MLRISAKFRAEMHEKALFVAWWPGGSNITYTNFENFGNLNRILRTFGPFWWISVELRAGVHEKAFGARSSLRSVIQSKKKEPNMADRSEPIKRQGNQEIHLFFFLIF